ncbi:MAG: radical SAM protein [Bacillota bacterium]|nr:radical SAM protein [Bacillota bacterium]
MKNREASYLKLPKANSLESKLGLARKHLTACNLCPHECNVNRSKKLGVCRASNKVVVSSYGPHFGEEAPLVGHRGSGTIFFGYCNMRCVFCQNCELSFGGEGETISNEKLATIMLKLQDEYYCHNINLVTPTHFVVNILEALKLAVEGGLRLPLVYNCGGYEGIETLKLLDGVIDIYMPDFKYNLDERGIKYSKVKKYPQMVKKALIEMDQQVGGLKLDEQGIAYRGLLIRHLMMPGGLEDTKEILAFIAQKLSSECMVNLMDQYFPEHQAFEFEEIGTRLSPRDYKEAVKFAGDLGLRLAY